MLYISACGTRSGIVEVCVIYIFRMPVERALVLWNFVLHISACGTHSGIMEFRVIFPACGTHSGTV